MKHQIVHALQKYVLNPPIKLMFAVGLAAPGYALLETIGRKSGKPRRTPVGNGRIGGQFWIVAEHAMKAGYILNIERNPRVRLKLRDGVRARWHTGTAHLLHDDDCVVLVSRCLLRKSTKRRMNMEKQLGTVAYWIGVFSTVVAIITRLLTCDWRICVPCCDVG